MARDRFGDLEARASEVLPEPVFRYFRQGARDGLSAAEATAAWDAYRLLPHVLRAEETLADGASKLLDEHFSALGGWIASMLVRLGDVRVPFLPPDESEG